MSHLKCHLSFFALHPPKSELLNSWRVTGLIQDYFDWEDGIKKEKCEFFKQLLLKGFPQKLTELLRNDFWLVDTDQNETFWWMWSFSWVEWIFKEIKSLINHIGLCQWHSYQPSIESLPKKLGKIYWTEIKRKKRFHCSLKVYGQIKI